MPPSFSPAASAGPPPPAPGSPAPGAGLPGQPTQDAPAQGGTPAGNNWEPAGDGWDLGNSRTGHDGPSTQALPVRNGNGAAVAPSNGGLSGAGPSGGGPSSDSTAPRTAAAGGPSRLPAFGGPGSGGPQSSIGSQNIHGSDGPSAANSASQGGAGQSGPAQGDADGQVTVPPGQEQRLPIFDSLESDLFRRSGQTLTTTQRAQGAPAGQQAGQGSWTSPADQGWRAAEVVASPAAGETTQAGLPRRVPRANLVPGSVGSGGQAADEAEAETPIRSPDAARSRMASFQRGVREGRAATPQIEEP